MFNFLLLFLVLNRFIDIPYDTIICRVKKENDAEKISGTFQFRCINFLLLTKKQVYLITFTSLLLSNCLKTLIQWNVGNIDSKLNSIQFILTIA